MPITWIEYSSDDGIKNATIYQNENGGWTVTKYDRKNSVHEGSDLRTKLTEAQAIARDWTK